jgi:hypothetical protein
LTLNVATNQSEARPMMASERQIEANRRNARLSTGPSTAEGKARSRGNATKHGLSGDLEPGEGSRAEFLERKAKWIEHIKPTSAEEEFALDRVVAATFRIEGCGEALTEAMVDGSVRASLHWDGDRSLEAARLAKRLAKNPMVVARQLETTAHGVEVLLSIWRRLGESLETAKGEWSAEEISTAFDVLGIPTQLRDGRAPFDPPEGHPIDKVSCRRSFVKCEVDRLQESLATALVPIDSMERNHAASGASSLRSKAAALILRYEREAWRHYDAMLAAAKADAAKTPAIGKVEVEEVEDEPGEEDDATPLKTIVAHPPEASSVAPPKGRKLNRRQRRAMAAGAGRR